MKLSTPQDHRAFFVTLCTSGLEEANHTIADYPIQDSLEFATIILDCMARDVYEYTVDFKKLSLLQSMQMVALAQISLVDLPSIQRLIKRSKNIRERYHKRIKYSGREEQPTIRRLDPSLF